ncbi:DUF547 domain-containing protein [Marinibaculum pumilum]|uniref:DUF547 domain-containing protein n=1 Tax=Marinibaculum pumilum TaxID=1766165 RepID=A0ABV7KYL9_9PROT
MNAGRFRQLLAALLLALSTAACAAIERAAIPAPHPLGPDWGASAAPPGRVLDHDAWEGFLAGYLTTGTDGVTRIDYAAVTAPDRAALQAYLDRLQAVPPASLTRPQQLAYWINLYNAATVALVLAHYPVASIRDIDDGLLSFGPWDREVVAVAGRPLSLNDIEHRILRPFFDEPRIHYALNCAAIGCPNLRPQAWRAEGLDTALDAAERAYVNDPRGVTVGPEGRLTLSKIWLWFRKDFGPDEAAVLDRLAARARPGLAAAIRMRGRVDGYDYDWSLNDSGSGS